jgi:phosphatidylglycerol:prolipoprotein diacylglycerol transferase
MHPELFSFQLFDKTIIIYSYGFFLLLALIFAVLVLYWQLGKRRLTTKKIFDNILWTILGGLIGARLFFVLFHFGFYLGNPREILRVWHGGLDFFGAFLGGFAVLIFWLLIRKKKEFWGWLDAVIVALTSGYAIATIGAFLLGSDYGRPSNVSWSVIFPSLSDNVSRHPTQIYDFVVSALILVFLIFASDSKIFLKRQGLIFFLGLFLLSLSRFAIEFFREPDIILWQNKIEFTSVHLLSLVLLLCGVVGIIWRMRKKH